MTHIEQIIDGIIAREGGYVDHPHDRGGPTKHGITESVARANGYQDDMRALPLSLARDIYRNQYYIRPGFDALAHISPAVAEELTDTGVNMGPPTAIRFLQRTLNALNLQQRIYPDLRVDGFSGHNTQAALRAYLARRGKEGEAVLLKALNALQAARYIEIAEANPTQESFVYGWLKERVA